MSDGAEPSGLHAGLAANGPHPYGRHDASATGARTQLNIRLTAAQDEAIRRHASDAKLSITGYVVSRCVASEDLCVLPLLQSELRALWDELHRQGVNLNQMAHRVNLLNDPADPRLDAALADLGPVIDEQRACLGIVSDTLEGIGMSSLAGERWR